MVTIYLQSSLLKYLEFIDKEALLATYVAQFVVRSRLQRAFKSRILCLEKSITSERVPNQAWIQLHIRIQGEILCTLTNMNNAFQHVVLSKVVQGLETRNESWQSIFVYGLQKLEMKSGSKTWDLKTWKADRVAQSSGSRKKRGGVYTHS